MTGEINPSVDLLKHFENVEEPRTTYLIEHKLLDIIALTIFAVISGADTWVEIEEYGHSNCDLARNFFGTPPWYSFFVLVNYSHARDSRSVFA